MAKIHLFIEKMASPLFLGEDLYNNHIRSYRDFIYCDNRMLGAWLFRWGISDIQSLYEKLDWLLYTGYRSQFAEDSHYLAVMSKEERQQYIDNLPMKDTGRHQLYWVNHFMDILTPSGIAAFDYALYQCIYATHLKFGDFDEKYDGISKDLPRIAHTKYRNWHEYFTACQAGMYYQSLPNEIPLIHQKNKEFLEITSQQPRFIAIKWDTAIK